MKAWTLKEYEIDIKDLNTGHLKAKYGMLGFVQIYL
jgi:hypothetical protein